jgi:heme-degrading monooxygenase HmoA
VVARVWRGRVRPGLLEEYRRYVVEACLPDYRAIPGNLGAYVFTKESVDHGDVITLSFWDSYDAIAVFAGDDIDRARYYAEDPRFLLDFPERVEHFEVTEPYATWSSLA